METNCKYLFIYGTLLSANNEYGKYLKANSQYISAGRFPGLLYDLGDYPGALYNSEATSLVYGAIVLVHDASVLKKLDEYEGHGDTEEQPNLFIREIIPVTAENGSINCWVYLYNLPVDGHPLITSGRYA